MLNDAEADALNRRGAEVMGWRQVNIGGFAPGSMWKPPGSSSADILPDFCRDAHSLGYLVGWLDEQKLPHWAFGFTVSHGHSYKSSLYANNHDSFAYSCCYTLGEALLRAIIAYAEKVLSAESEKPNAL